MRRGWGAAAALAAAGASLAGAFAFSGGLARAGAAAPDRAELTFFPRSEVIRPLTFGHARLAADLAWLEAIQYYGKHRMTDRRYPYAETLFRTLTGLDPGFEAAYVFGALVLCEHTGRAADGMSLLAEGMRMNPASWRLCFEYGFFAYLERKDSAEAVRYLTRASRMPGCPPSVGRLAAYAAGTAGERELAVELWREMLRSADNDAVRAIARRYLRSLGAPEAADAVPGGTR